MAILAAAAAWAPPAAADSLAVAVADRVMEAIGGRERWDALVGLRWTFQTVVNDTVRGARRHAWNKHSGWHRVEGRNRAGQAYVVVASLDTAAGRAWVDGQAIAGDSLAAMLRLARSLWINDSYWLLMPFKLRDPGVVLRYDGERHEAGRVFDRLALSFAGVGQTPGDRYWVDFDRDTRRVERWEYVLESAQPPPLAWTWGEWEQHHGLWFATVRVHGRRTILTRDIEAVDAFPPDEFTAP